jgi:DNA adenine methylase
LEQLPKDIARRRYVEPFLGAASLFFAVNPKNAILADANKALIETYQAIRDHPEEVRTFLIKLI